MKSRKRPSKLPKPNNSNPKLDLVAIRPAEKQQVASGPDPAPALEPLPDEPQAITDKEPQAEPQPQAKVIIHKPPSIEQGEEYTTPKKSGDTPKPKQRQFTESNDEEELPPQQCQKMQFLDCDKSVGRVIYECWHCLTGLVSEYTGSPVVEEFRGRKKEKAIEVECPNCGKSAIRLSVKEVISTEAFASPRGD
ncbi:MAG: hypothetical protein KME21_31795 [Desmonostoc vinosum HA7617-LM4]|jgi:type IV secretory pathway VirB10-like protein|nr:hypothetical protein [Desmonostoc vinosum HA7617-LM4]